MKEDEILELFAGVKSGRVSEQEALKYLKNYPYEDVAAPRSTLSAHYETARAK